MTERLLKLAQEDLFAFFQSKLAEDFLYDDDTVVESLHIALEELRRAKMDTPGKPPTEELPQNPFGLFVPPSVEQLIGRRTLHSEHDLLSDKRRSLKDMRPVIPADGGPVVLPFDLDISRNSAGESELASNYDTGTHSAEGSSVSATEFHAAYLDTSDVASTATSLSRPYSSHPALNESDPPWDEVVEYPEPGDPAELAKFKKEVALYEADLERTLEAMELQSADTLVTHSRNVSVIEVNGHHSGYPLTSSPERTPIQSPNQTPVHSPVLETPPFTPRSAMGTPYTPTGYPFPVTPAPVTPVNGPNSLPVNGLAQAEYHNGYPEAYYPGGQYSLKQRTTDGAATSAESSTRFEASVYL